MEGMVATNITKNEDLKTFSIQQEIATFCIEMFLNKQKAIKPQEGFGRKCRMRTQNKSEFIKIYHLLSN